MRAGGGTAAVRLALAAATVVLVAHGAARAAGGGAPDALEWDIAFGTTVTSDYMSRGLSNSEHGAAVQPWAELDIGDFYAGYWGSNVTASGVSYWEHDLSVGVRPTLGPRLARPRLRLLRLQQRGLRLAVGRGLCQGFDQPVDPLTLGLAFYIDPENTAATYSELNAAYDCPHGFSVSGAVGFVTANDDYGDYTTWNVGASWKPAEPVTLDARYHAGPETGRFVFRCLSNVPPVAGQVLPCLRPLPRRRRGGRSCRRA